MSQPIPEETRLRLQELLKPIAQLFAASHITLVVRAPEGANSVGNLVLSSDNPTKVLAVLKEHAIAEAKRFAAEGARSGTEGAQFPHHSPADRLY